MQVWQVYLVYIWISKGESRFPARWWCGRLLFFFSCFSPPNRPINGGFANDRWIDGGTSTRCRTKKGCRDRRGNVCMEKYEITLVEKYCAPRVQWYYINGIERMDRGRGEGGVIPDHDSRHKSFEANALCRDFSKIAAISMQWNCMFFIFFSFFFFYNRLPLPFYYGSSFVKGGGYRWRGKKNRLEENRFSSIEATKKMEI